MKNAFIILAAGEGKRMKSKYSKVVQKIMGKPMILYITDEVERTFEDVEIVIVVGHKKEDVYKLYDGKNIKFAVQEEQLGTGHAVMTAKDLISSDVENVFVIYGDTPFIRGETLLNMLDTKIDNDAKLCLLTAKFDNPFGYGRIVTDENGNVLRIVEEKDADEQTKKINEINPGFYCFSKDALFEALGKIDNNNAQKEYYLTDTIEALNKLNYKVTKLTVLDNFEVVGINSRYELSLAEKELRKRINKKHLDNGVMIVDPDNTYIDIDVEIGKDAIIYPGSFILGNTKIGEDSVIGPQSYIVDSIIGNHCEVIFSMIEESVLEDNVKIGPYSHLRPHSTLEEGVKIGNFVEIKNSRMGKGSKSAHLTYVGDADVGEDVNLGCGTIFVNYDGFKKHKTVVGNKAFIGCNSNLVAPVNIGENAFIAAGSTITQDVPANALAIARQKQVNKEGWVLKRKAIYGDKK
ncbi:bifunctional UDP-N-acetylglucosamine diphosphorylase/glucosamine-1-phosphate N-acetyltransferase GlmU [Caldicellulosiruptoraceae bacterium PP1]